jgi:adenylylsulfate kinase
MRILVFGLPGSGKTTLCKELIKQFKKKKIFRKIHYLNADKIRKQYSDFDFTLEGRKRQAERMRELADKLRQSPDDVVIADFICPLRDYRNIFDPHYMIFVDTIKKSIYNDTNQIFQRPISSSFRVKTKDAKKWGKLIVKHYVQTFETEYFDSWIKVCFSCK